MNRRDSWKKPENAADEPIDVHDGNAYAYDGEQSSPMSPGLKRMMAVEGVSDLSKCHQVTNIIAVALLFAILITSVISITAGACCLSSLSGKPFKHFPLLLGLGGVAPVVLGGVCFVLVLLVILFISCCAMGLGSYGRCCVGTSRCRSAARVCLLGVFPFIVFLVLLATCILGFSFYSLSRQQAPLDKDYIKVAGITGPVEIVRDENGITHVKASSRRDAYFGQGFAEAQDRLFQLEFHRTVAKGTLSSMVGQGGTSTDTSIRTINVRDAAYALCNNTTPDLIDLLQAFADGVNLYLERVSKRPVEFFFMSTKPLRFHDPEPFSAIDLCLTARLFQWQMSSNVDAEGQRFAVWAGTNRTFAEVEELYQNFTGQPNTVLSTKQMIDLMSQVGTIVGTDGAAPTEEQIDAALARYAKAEAVSNAQEAAIYDKLLSILRTQLQSGAASSKTSSSVAAVAAPSLPSSSVHAVVESNIHRVMQQTFYSTDEKRTAFPYQFLDASNAWATRLADGKVMVASDPHLTINLPSIWYYVHLSFPDDDGVQFDAAGVSMVGVSGVHIGKTTYVAWGITMSKTDLQDLFILPPAAFSGLPARTYRYGGVDRVFVKRRERIQVKGKKDIVLDADDTLLGPVVSTMLGFPPALTVTLSAAALQHDDSASIGTLLAWSDPRTKTAETLMNALLDLQAPGFSIPIGDVNGNIAYAVTGRHPLRNSGHSGKYPTPAFDAMALLTAMQQAIGAAGGGPVNMTALLARIPPILKASNWSSYPAVDSRTGDRRVPRDSNPHIHLPFDGTEAHISAANQKVVPLGYPYFLGADYSWPWRGRRVQETLDASTGKLHDANVHMDLQRDYHSNMWLYDMRAIVNSTAFLAAIADDVKSTAWADRLLNHWDGTAPIGSVETSFLWLWIARMSVLPRDAITASGVEVWAPSNGYITRMLSQPTARMLAECQDVMRQHGDANACWNFATAQFKAQAADGEKQWGKDLNHLRGIHEMVDTKPIYPLFRREMEKAGDRTSVGVSDHAVTGSMLSTQAASVRQVFDLWNHTDITYVGFPGGNSGNPYSKFYQNMWEDFKQDVFVAVKVRFTTWDSIQVSHKQTLGH